MPLFSSFFCGFNCTGELGDGVGKSARSSNRQQFLVIQQLRESHRKKDASTRGKIKLKKIVPLAISVSPNKASIGDNGLAQPNERARLKELKAAERAARSMVEENNLKSALTHPTILKFLKAFMVAQSTDNMLDFYLDVAEIRGLHRRRYTKAACELWRTVAAKYLLDKAPCKVQIDPKHREMIAGKLMPRRRLSATEIVLATVLVVNTRTLDRKILEGLELAQHEIFYIIKTDSWRPFCDSDIFASLLLRKEVRTTLQLRRPKNSEFSGGSFMSVMGSDAGNGGGSVCSDKSIGSQRSFRRTSPSMYSKGGSNNNSFYGNKDNNNSTKAGIGIGAAGGGGGGQKREIRLLSCIVRDMGSSASSAQQLYRRSPNASPDRDRNTSSYHPPFLSCKSPKLPPISKPYNEHGYKLNEEDNDKSRTDRSFKCKGNDNNQIFDATLIDNAESEVVRELIGSPSYKNSLILKMLCKTVSGSNMNVDRCTDQCTDGCTDTLSACGTVSGESQISNFERLH